MLEHLRGLVAACANMDFDKYDNVILALYDAAAGGTTWTAALGAFTDLLHAFASTLLVWDNTAQQPVLQTTTDRFDPDAVRAYGAYYSALDRMRKIGPLYGLGRIANCAEIITPEEVAKSEFHQDFLIPYGGRFVMGAMVSDEPTVTTAIGVHRGSARGPFEQRDTALLKRLSPHLSRATAIYRKTLVLQTQMRLGQHALDHVPWFVIVVDAQARVLFINHPADAAVQRGNGLGVHNGKLITSSAERTTQLHASIARAVGLSLRQTREPAFPIAVERSDGQGAYALLVAPLPSALDALTGTSVPAAIILATAPSSNNSASGGLLMKLYGLTRAEARAALGVAQGLTIDEIAERSGVGRETIRTQIKAALSKTGTRRQAELVSLLGNLPKF